MSPEPEKKALVVDANVELKDLLARVLIKEPGRLGKSPRIERPWQQYARVHTTL